MAIGITGRPDSTAVEKGPHVERHQAGHAEDGAFGEEHQRSAVSRRLGHAFGVGGACFLVEAFDEEGTDAAQVNTRHELGLKLRLGDETELTGQGRH